MKTLDPRSLKAEADAALQAAAYDPQKLILIHTGVIMALSLVLTALDYLLEQQIGTTGGLSGMGTRSILSTLQSLLSAGQALLLPFWQLGHVFAAIRIHQRQSLSPGTLLEGFRRFGPVLRLQLLLGFLYFGVLMISTYLTSFLFMLTPWAAPLVEAMEPLLTDPSSVMDEATEAAIMEAAVPMIGMMLVAFLILCAPVYYRFRMAEYALLDNPGMGALAAMLTSAIIMRGRRFRLFRLDLSFWWFYALDLLAAAVCYGDVLLSMAGITLPWPPAVSFFVPFILYLICQLALYWWKKNQVAVTYAAAYAALAEPRQPETQPQPRNLPWNYE